MKRLLSVVVVLAILPCLRAEETKENPYKNAKVGDWVEYKTVTSIGDLKIEGSAKSTVTKKSDKEVTVKTVTMAMGMEIPGQETTVDLTKPFDPLSAANLPKDADFKVEKMGTGKEKVKVTGKDYDAEWTQMKVKGSTQGVELDGTAKVWLAPSAPLGGVVKMEMNFKVAGMDVKVTMELAGSGSK